MNKNFNIIIRTRIRFIALLLLCGIMCSESMLAGTLTESKRYFITGGSGITDWSEKENWELSSSDGNKYTGTFYFEGQSDNYKFKIYRKDNATLYANNGFWFNDSNTTATGVDGTGNSDMQIVPCTNSWMFKVSFELWCDYSSNSKLIVTRTTESSGYFMKHNWNDKGWTWKKLTRIGSTTRYYTDDLYGGSGCNYRSSTSGNYIESPTLVGSPATGDNCRFTYDSNDNSITITKMPNETPTVNIAANESVASTDVTLNGYVKFNGCKTISEYGFVYGTGNTPTTSDNKVKVGENNISRGSSYSKTFEESTNETYNYRAYIIAGSTTYYSSEIRQFTIDFTCDLSSLDATIDGGSSSVKVFSSGTSESATLSSVTFANVYHWECTSENSSHVTFENANQRETTVTVSEEGMYTFRLGAKCTGDANYTYSENVTLYTCAKPDGTLLLDGYSANILCQDEMATATIKSRSGYTYTLYRGETEIASLTGNGRTLKWHNVEGEGTFTVKAHPTALPACTHTLSSATQSYNIPNIGIDISPASAVPAFTPVTLTKSDASTIDKEPFWEITEGASTGYLLNGSTSIKYDDRARHSVIFKGGLVVESNEEVTTFYKVKAKGYKKVNLETGDNATTKECESSVVIELSTFKASPCQ